MKKETLLLSLALSAVLSANAQTPASTEAERAAPAPVAAKADTSITEQQIVDWVGTTVVQSFAHNYMDWPDVVAKAGQTWYTPAGKDALRNVLSSSGHIETIQAGHYAVLPQIAHAPKITDQTDEGWTVSVPMLLEYHKGDGANAESTKGLVLNMTVARVPATTSNPLGLAATDMTIAEGASK